MGIAHDENRTQIYLIALFYQADQVNLRPIDKEKRMTWVLAGAFFLIAVLYAAVGSGGGSGYLAVMGLVGVEPAVMRPTALALNVLVTVIGTWRYVRAGHFSGRLFWPIAAAAMPFAFLGGRWLLPTAVYRPIVALVLFYAALKLWQSTQEQALAGAKLQLPLWVALLAGAVIGLLSGLVGVGGGIFLGPLLMLTGWASTRQTLGITSAFVLVNSLAGLAGQFSAMATLPPGIWLWLTAVAVGGWLGAEFGSQRLDPRWLRRLLALVLLLGGIRLLF